MQADCDCAAQKFIASQAEWSRVAGWGEDLTNRVEVRSCGQPVVSLKDFVIQQDLFKAAKNVLHIP